MGSRCPKPEGDTASLSELRKPATRHPHRAVRRDHFFFFPGRYNAFMIRGPFIIAALAAAFLPTTPSDLRSAPAALPDRLGVAHVDPKYHFGDKPVLVEGAERILELGSRVIKLWLTPDAPAKYAANDRWPECRSLVELAQTPSFKAVFAMPFTAYVLETYPHGRPDHYWREGVSPEQKAREIADFEALASHFLTAYRGTGKTFVLQNWEGDWAAGKLGDPDAEPTPTAVQGMVAWLNARQEGVERARANHPAAGCSVYHAAEVNLIGIALDGKRRAIVDLVIPGTRCDLYSYSAYDTAIPQKRFREALAYYADRAPDSKAFGANNVYVGEYGIPENDFSPEKVRDVIRHNTETALAFGCPFVVYWQLYDNEARRTPVKVNADCRGFWLIRPDGSKSGAWDYFERRFRIPDIPAKDRR